MKKEVKKANNKDLILYTDKKGNIELKADIKKETVWASLDQIAFVFGRDKSVISRHIKDIYKTGELSKSSTVAKNATVQMEGNREVVRHIEYYNLDMILSVGYRVNSKQATNFRIWATRTLKQYLIDGYVLNKKRILKNYKKFIETVSNIQSLLPAHITLDPKAILELVKEFATTWQKLDQYDRDDLVKIGTTKKKVKLQGEELLRAIFDLKNELIKKGEATDIFANERVPKNVEGIVGNVTQSFGGKEVYGTLEEKAAHLLYFMVKNHPFTDGNKRSGAFAFIWFLRKFGIKGARNINPAGLTALTLLIAESNPEHKDKMVALVVELLKVK